DAAKAARIHAVPNGFADVEAGAEIGVDHRVPHHAVELAHRRIARDAGVVDHDLDRTEFFLDSRHCCLDRLEIAHIELVDGNAGFLLEGGSGDVVSGVIGGDLIATQLQHPRNGSTNA